MHRQGEHQLLAEKEKLESIVKGIGAGLSLLDSEARIVWANEMLQKWFGSINVIKGIHCCELYDLKDPQKECAALRTLQSGQIERGEAFASVIDGERRYFQLTTVPLKDEKGRITQIVELTQDVTERKQAEEALRISKEFMETVFNSVYDSISIIDTTNFIIMGVNQAFLDKLNMEEKDVIGKHCYEVTHHISRPCEPPNFCPLAETLKTGDHSSAEHKHSDKDGREIYVEVSTSPIRNEKGEIYQVVHVAHDISERKHAEEKLRVSEDKFRNIAERSFDLIITADSEGRFTYVSPATNRVLNFQPEELIGKPFRSIIPESNISKATRAFNDLMNGNNIENLQVELSRKDGALVTVEGNAIPIIIEGKVAGAQGIFRDITDRRRAEEALQKSEEHYHTLFDQSPAGVFLYDKDLRMTQCNQRLVQIMRSSYNKLIGLDLHTLKDQSILPAIMKVFEGTSSYHEGFYSSTTGKAQIWAFWHFAPLRDARGNIFGGMGVVEDVTERKQADESRSFELRFNKAIADLSTALISQGPLEDTSSLVLEHAKHLTGSKIGYVGYIDERTGYLVSPTLTRDVWDICHIEDKNFVFKEFTGLWGWVLNNQKSILTNAPKDDPRSSGTPAGHIPIHNFLSAPAVIGETLIGQVSVANSDHDYNDRELRVVERLAALYAIAIQHKRAEESIQDSEAKYRALFESSSDAIMMLNEKGFFDCNYATLRLFGLQKKEDFIRMHPAEVSPPFQPDGVDSLTAANNKIAEAFRNGTNMFEWVNRRKNGEDFPASVLLTAFQYKGKQVLQATVRDITVSKRAEEIRIENERLACTSKAKSDFLANMSHELRTPLNGIIGFSELLLCKVPGELNEKQEGYTRDINTSGTHLLRLINDILDLSKVEAGKIELAVENFSVPQAINEGFALVKEKAMKHNIILKTELDPALEFIEADVQRFKQILFNLLSNAVKFSKPEGGTVTVKTVKEGGMARISVSDTGIGIKEEGMGKLFREFEQIDSGISRKYGGTGLGLAISKKLVELHGGKITAESRYGEGSTFTFLVPIKLKAKSGDQSRLFTSISAANLGITL